MFCFNCNRTRIVFNFFISHGTYLIKYYALCLLIIKYSLTLREKNDNLILGFIFLTKIIGDTSKDFKKYKSFSIQTFNTRDGKS